jgi:hypothetical protein
MPPAPPCICLCTQAAAQGRDVGDYNDYNDLFNLFNSGGGGDEGDGQVEKTVFGIQPAEHEALQPELHMLGKGVLELQDMTCICTRLPWVGCGMEESPTLWGDGGGGCGG